MQLKFSCTLLFLTAILGCATSDVRADAYPDDRKTRAVVLDTMSKELNRSMALKFKDYQAPYFISYTLKDTKTETIAARFGSVVYDDEARNRNLYVEVRVGDYDFDNYANVEGESFRLNELTTSKRAPWDGNTEALQGALWLMTDYVYKKAVSDYLTKKGGAVYSTDEKTKEKSFSKETAAKFVGKPMPVRFQRKRWRKFAEKLSKSLTKHPELFDSSVDVSSTRKAR